MSSSPLLAIKDLHVWFPVKRGVFARVTGHIRAVQGVSLIIHPGEVVGLVGESGCGKSTLARSILLLQPPAQGSIELHGHELYRGNPETERVLRRDVQIIFQDPYASLNPRLPVVEILTEGLLASGQIKRRSQESVALDLLHDVGLGRDALFRYPHEFSGGQRQRICIARALSMKPKLIVCDEAVSALDVSVQAQVLNLLMELKSKYQLSYLFISHDLSVVRFVSDRVAVMYLGRIVEQGECRAVLEHPMHPYTKALLASVPTIGGERNRGPALAGEMPSVANPPPGCPFHTRCPIAMDVCRSTYPREQSIRSHSVSCHAV